MPIADPVKRKEYHTRYMREIWYPKNKKKHQKMVARNKRQRMDKFRELKSKLKCNRCEEDDAACLDFHHSNPNEKEYGVGAMAKDFAWDKVLAEIEKCEILCANCHRKEHNAE